MDAICIGLHRNTLASLLRLAYIPWHSNIDWLWSVRIAICALRDRSVLKGDILVSSLLHITIQQWYDARFVVYILAAYTTGIICVVCIAIPSNSVHQRDCVAMVLRCTRAITTTHESSSNHAFTVRRRMPYAMLVVSITQYGHTSVTLAEAT